MSGERAFLRQSHPMDRTRLVGTRGRGGVAHAVRGRSSPMSDRRGAGRGHGALSDPRSSGSYWMSP